MSNRCAVSWPRIRATLDVVTDDPCRFYHILGKPQECITHRSVFPGIEVLALPASRAAMSPPKLPRSTRDGSLVCFERELGLPWAIL